MRLRHVKGSEEKLINSNYVINDPIKHKGKFNEIFNNNNPIHIEIGSGKGNFIIEKAKKHKDINFIAIERQSSVLVRILDKIDELPNLKLIYVDAVNIDNIFDKEIDTIYLNFSDPWPKKKHAKRRLTSDIFLDKYEKIFKNDRLIEIKTDNRKLFEYSIITLTNHDYKIEKISLNLYEDDILDNIPTEYEMKFVEKGMIIYQLKVKK